MFCPNCGKQLDDNSVFCGECGTRLEEQYSVPDAVVPVQAAPVQAAQPQPVVQPQQNYGNPYQQIAQTGPDAGFQQGTGNPYQQQPPFNPGGSYQQPAYSGYDGPPITFADFWTANGRLNRLGYFLRGLILSAVAAPIALITGGFGIFLILIPNLFISVRRLHDLGKSGWNLLVPYVSFFLVFMGSGIGFFGALGGNSRGAQSLMGFGSVVTIIGCVLGIWGLVISLQMLFCKGTDGPNQYGPDPLVPPQQQNNNGFYN